MLAKMIAATGCSASLIFAASASGAGILEAAPGEKTRSQIAVDTGGRSWEEAGALTFLVANESAVEVGLRIGLPVAGLHASVQLAPGENTRVQVELRGDRNALRGLRRGPTREGHRRTRTFPAQKTEDAGAVVEIGLSGGEQPARVRIAEVALVDPISLDGMVDAFGQFARADWPGKIGTAEVLKQESPASSVPEDAGRDEFGGWADGPKLRASGFFRTEKVAGRWWFVTPSGHLFFSLGVNTVGQGNRTVVAGRASWFEFLPPPEQREADGQVNFHRLNLERKYGRDFFPAWRDKTFARLAGWGFNTLANWSDERLWEARRMPFTARVLPEGDYPVFRPGIASKHGVPDPFDPAYGSAVSDAMEALAPRVREDPWLLGYFVQNEIDWGLLGEGAGRTALARAVLGAKAPSPAKRAFREFLEARHKSIEQLNRAWGVELQDWEQIEAGAVEVAGGPEDAAHGDLLDLVRLFAAEYFRVTREAIRRHDPNHLYLGCRFGSRWCTPEVLEEAAKVCDAIAVNAYADAIREDQSPWKDLAPLDVPVIVAEFHFGATDRGMFHGGMNWVADQEARAGAYRRFLASAARSNYVAGCHWFEFVDQPLTGRPGDGESAGIGLVTVADVPHRELTDAMRDTNFAIYRMATEASKDE